jgi:hypothetical protein
MTPNLRRSIIGLMLLFSVVACQTAGSSGAAPSATRPASVDSATSPSPASTLPASTPTGPNAIETLTPVAGPASTDSQTNTPPPSHAQSSSETAVPSDTPAPSGTQAQSGGDPVLIAAGDIASCISSGDEATAALVDNISGTVATLGDNVYEDGSAQQYAACYDPTWGRFKARTRPAPGNHDYLTPGSAAYFAYFGATAGSIGHGYYSYDLGAWHIVVLDSQCWDIGGCGATAPQAQWLQADLSAHPALCALAYWHTPRFSSGIHGGTDQVQAMWDKLYAAGADLVLNGHDHDYERFAPQNPSGAADPAHGLREFVVGTGGRSHYTFPGAAQPNSEARNDNTYGVLKLTLHTGSYDWTFVPVAGSTYTDSGSGACHP